MMNQWKSMACPRNLFGKNNKVCVEESRTLINERGDLLPFFVYKFFFGYIIKDVTERYNYNREVAL